MLYWFPFIVLISEEPLLLKDVHDVKFLLDRKLMIIQNEIEIIAELI